MSERTHRQLVEKATESLFEASKRVNPRFRQRYHFMAPAYWLNDPNGLIEYKGKYHLFYQHNPYDAVWGPMHWGHAVSTDFIHWEHLPIALAPSEDYEAGNGGCFSGSAVEDNGRLMLLYTGACSENESAVQVQCLAASSDGIRFEKYEGNPVLKLQGKAGKDFRDPKVWRHGDSWYMVAVSCQNNSGEALLYQSDNLIGWNYKGVLAQGNGKMGRMWECPDFFELDGTGVLLFSPIEFKNRKASYLTGKMDYGTFKFSHDILGETDWGFDFYAAQSFEDSKGRRILIGWANGWDWMSWWNGFGPTKEDLWCGYMSIPREVSLCSDGKLSFKPVEELKQLRISAKAVDMCTVESDKMFDVQAGDGISFELTAEFDLKRTTAKKFGFLLRCSESERTVVECDLENGELVFDRSESDQYSKGIKRCPLESCGRDTLSLHIFSDTCSVEIFTDDGRTVMCSSIFPSPDSKKLHLYAKGGAVCVNSIKTWGLQP